jgi:conjugal transfer pilus assembly protein TraA
MFKVNHKAATTALAAVATVATVAAVDVMAGTSASIFQGVLDLVTEWMTGQLGAIVASVFVLVGIVSGIARQSIMAFAIGIGGGVGLFYSPAIITGIVSATLPTLL